MRSTNPVCRRVAWRLAGGWTRPLERAPGEIARRQEELRTIFGGVDGPPVPVIAPFGGANWRWGSSRARTSHDQRAEPNVRDVAAAMARC